MLKSELKMLQALPYEIKVAKSKLRIREAIEYFGANSLYVPVSGGIDSTVVSHLVHQVQKEMNIEKNFIPRVNSNTGNEYPSVLKLARELSDIEVKPYKSFYDVLREEGYPVASKKTSRMLRDLQNPTELNRATRKLYLTGIKRDGTKGTFKLAKKYLSFINSPIRCTEKCCFYLKKEPLFKYERKTGRHPFLGTMADEKGPREQGYLKTGCNAFSQGKSMPIGFWTKTDVLIYVLLNDIKIADVYGDIALIKDTKLVPISKKDVQNLLSKNEYFSLTTTLEKRTGCVACTYGVQFEDKKNNRFHRLKKINPKYYNFIINGGFIDVDGKWKPKDGLGLWFVLDMMGIDYGNYEQLKFEDFLL